MKKYKSDYLAIITVILMCITTLTGILSMDFTHKYEVINQYGHTVEMYGYGIYAHDTYFSAPISIGTDYCVLFIIVPMFSFIFWQYRKTRSKVAELKLISMYAITFYYAASIAFGITYNRFFLIYMILFSCSLFDMFYHIYNIDWNTCITYTKGMKRFLVISGIALYVAWFPDILPTLLTGEITEFYSDERQTGKVDGEERMIGWRCECTNYNYVHGIRYPKELKAIKVYPDREIVYFDANQIAVSYRNNFLK